MSKTASTHKKKIKLSYPNDVDNICNRLLNSSFEQPSQSHTQSCTLLEQIKFPSYKVRAHENDFEKLAEITDRCISYKHNFIQNYENQMNYFQQILRAEKQQIYNYCETLIKKVNERRDKLLEDLISKQYEIKLHWQNSLNDLQSHLQSIAKTNLQNVQISSINRQEFDEKLGHFTNLVSTFYRKIRILQIKVAEDLDQTQFSDIRNQAKALSELKLPTSGSILENRSFTFNQMSPDSNLCLQKLSEILENQKQRDIKIESYKENMR